MKTSNPTGRAVPFLIPSRLRLALWAAGLAVLPATAAGSNPALKALFDQAAYWHEKAHDELARDALQKVLMVEADNPEALYLLSLYAMQGGDKAAAAQWRQKLSAASPGDPRLTALDNASAVQAIPPTQLATARQLAARGAVGQALEAYRMLFSGSTPPESLADEYYLTMAGDQTLLPQAIDGLKARVNARPTDSAARLALGKAMTYQAATRRDGISLLAGLSEKSTDAAAALRQALLWLTPQPEDQPLYQAYQQQHPNDSGVMAYFQKNVGGAAKGEGFTALNSGNTGDAEAKFASVLATNPNDADALAGMGYIAQRSGNFAKAEEYLTRAAQQGGPESEKWRAQAQDAHFYAALADAKKAATAGDTDRALTLSAPLTAEGGEKGTAAALFRADVLRRTGDLPGAAQLYRALLTQNSENNDAKSGLYYVLRQQGDNAQANAVLQTLPAALRPRVQPAGVNVEPLRREAAEALQANNPQRALLLLQQAQEKQPDNIWVTLDRARILARLGDSAQAQALMAPAAEPNAPASAAYAAALFASENGNWPQTDTLLARIPARNRTAAMRELAGRARFNRQMAAANAYLQSGNLTAAANTFHALAQTPPTSPADSGALAKGLLAAGEADSAVALVRQSMQQGVKGNAGDYADQITVLNAAGLSSEAQAWLSNPAIQANSSPQQISTLRTGFVINEADQLREQGQNAAAYDTLIVALQNDPQNRDLMLAMARLYQSGKMNKEAGKVYDYLLARDTPAQDARAGAVDVALADNDIPRARQLMSGFTGPRTPQRLLQAARVAEAQGDHDEALALLRSAKGKMIGLQGADGRGTPSIAGLALADNPFINRTTRSARPTTASSYGSVMPWQQSDATLNGGQIPGAPVSPLRARQSATLKQVDAMLDALQEQHATWAQGGLSIRGRDGESGLSQLTEAKAPMTFSAEPFDSARVSFTATPVSLSAGSSSDTGNSRFGQGALAQAQSAKETVAAAATAAGLDIASYSTLAKLQTAAAAGYIANCGTNATTAQCAAYTAITSADPTTYSAPESGNQNASGVELALAVSGDRYKADIGSTPLGQDLNALVGGVQWSPKLGDNTTLTVTAERRAVTDSLLAYVGTEDTYSGKTWGQVTKNGGSLNLSYDNGDAGFYAGVGYYSYLGHHVASNQSIETNAGLYVRPYRLEDRELKTGVNVGYMDFSKNLSYFSYGQGGYFSPQNYVSVAFPVEYTQKMDDWDLKLNASVGYQSYSKDKSAYFPDDPALQSQLESLVAAGFGSEAYYAGSSENGIGWNLGAAGNYHLNRNMIVGGKVGYDTFGDYNESRAELYFRYLLDRN
ncbi:cellulose synthase subunit BcsC-related outer membrane protein [Chimaeribacter arupi]|uniref:cellulose biosynthesis protein BcsC n=1 Tax=Chimaeribacter arupi TaxID=2060066 RepID=UPI002712175F|nr:cellulose biosynthesis protein BcsC [Chimaeribacter arupi]WKZ92485.1 cellulose synthase subunit BcsC-related outer membrane protein [Chimaeribacter arupi]